MLRCFLVFHVRVNLKAIVHQNKLMDRLYGRNGKRGIVVKHFSNDIIKLTESKRQSAPHQRFWPAVRTKAVHKHSKLWDKGENRD